MKIYDSELKVLNVLWENGKTKASDIAHILSDTVGWNKNTTYTVIKRCVEKELIIRTDPEYICTAAITQKKAAYSVTEEILDTYFDGSIVRFFLTLLNIRPISKYEFKELMRILKNRTPLN